MSELATRPVRISDLAQARQRRRPDAVPLLSGVAPFDGIAEDDLARLVPALRSIELGRGDLLWRQGDPCKGLAVLIAGEAQVCRQLPGEREIELARLGPGDVLGEIALLGKGEHSATVRCLGPCSLLLLGPAEFEACTASFVPGAQELRRGIIALVCRRLRRALAGLAASDDAPDAPHRDLQLGDRGCEASCTGPRPPLDFLTRLPLLRGLERDLVAEVVGSATVLELERGAVVQHEWAAPERCYITLNGAVEDVVHRRGAPLRVGFAGPGHAFGYVGLLDGQPAPVSSVTRERCLLLAIDRDRFATLLEDRRLRPLAAALDADLVGALQKAERTLSHLAAAWVA
jgi:CRP/FNR family cyclic AMP-dependent transcriptional regulator